jgi:O-antigen/teichoic acid export membrane protein
VGDKVADGQRIGAYIRSAEHLRNRLLLFVTPLAAIAFSVIATRHRWPWMIQGLLFLSILTSLFFQGWASYYSTPFLIRQKLKDFYKPQVMGAVARLIVLYVLHSASFLTAWLCGWVLSSIVAAQGWFYRKRVKTFISIPPKSDFEKNKEILRYVLPTTPWVIFTALQGQVALLLVSLFGNVRNIAEVAALGRLGQLFVLLGVSNSIIVAPYFARVSRLNLVRRYAQFLSFAVGLSTLICATAFLLPRPFLWALGSRYGNLRLEIGWAVLSASVGYVCTLLMSIHNARKWIYWWWSVLHIVVLLLVQILCLSYIDLSSTLGAIQFSLICNVAAFMLLTAAGIYGFIFGPPNSLKEATLS